MTPWHMLQLASGCISPVMSTGAGRTQVDPVMSCSRGIWRRKNNIRAGMTLNKVNETILLVDRGAERDELLISLSRHLRMTLSGTPDFSASLKTLRRLESTSSIVYTMGVVAPRMRMCKKS